MNKKQQNNMTWDKIALFIIDVITLGINYFARKTNNNNKDK